MDKTKISLATIGLLPKNFDKKKLIKWKSALFEVADYDATFSFTANSSDNWQYKDADLERMLPAKFEGDILIAVTRVPLELDWYSRRLSKNRVIFTFHEIEQILDHSNIPLENVLLRLLYSYTLFFKANSNSIPTYLAASDFTHDDTRGCIFDMNGTKTDIIYSCDRPIICPQCVQRFHAKTISNEMLSTAKNEISNIKKTIFFRAADFVKRRPILSILITCGVSILMNLTSSLIWGWFTR